jgi:hypothetical protein
MIPAKNRLQLTAPYTYHDNLFKEDQWSRSAGVSYSDQEGAFSLPSAGAQITQEVTFSETDYVRNRLVLNLRARNVGAGGTESPLNIRVQIYGRVNSAAATTYYLTGLVPTPSRPNVAPYAWRTAVSDIEVALPAPAKSDTKNDAEDVEIVIPLYLATRAYAYAYNVRVTLSNASGTYGIYLYDISLSQYDRSEGVKVTAVIENNAREKADDVDLHMADTSKLNPGEKFLMSGMPVSPTGLFFNAWKVPSLPESTDYIQAMASDYAMRLGAVRRQYTGRLHVGDEKIPALFSRDGVYYSPRSYSYDLYEDEMEVDLISIPNVNVEVEIK